jgi:hypothetical protein
MATPCDDLANASMVQLRNELTKAIANDQNDRADCIQELMAKKTASANEVPPDGKVYKFRSASNAGVSVKDNKVAIVGSRDNHITSDGQWGNFINGKTSIIAPPEQIRISGLWTFRPELLSTVPSTIVTPLPVFAFDPPTGNIDILEATVELFKGILT